MTRCNTINGAFINASSSHFHDVLTPPFLTSVIFQNNTYDSTEGAVVIHPKNSDQHRMPIMTNVTFIANINSDVSGGGALHVLTSGSP